MGRAIPETSSHGPRAGGRSVSLVRFDNVSQSFGTRAVRRGVFFRLESGDRVGLIGKNGVGKTTVLRLILGQQEPTEGTIEVEQGLRVGHFSQFSELGGQESILEVLGSLFSDIQVIESRLAEIASLLGGASQGSKLRGLVNQQAGLLEEMNRREGWTYQHRIDTVLTRLGFPDTYRTRPIGQLSSGWRNRAALAKMLLEAPDVLLMDEPTNYLDVDGLQWLEEWLQSVRGALIVVSHDRHFLDQVANRIVEIENYHFQEYQGNFAQHVREKQLRFRRDRMAIVGPNGCGKTSLLNVLIGLEPTDAGRVAWAKAVETSYYNLVPRELDPNDTVTHAVNVVGLAYRAPRKRVNRFLSLLGFSELGLKHKIGTLSGGQQARVALAQCLLSGASVIVLDEPTNHLDLTSTQVMERALVHYPGSIVVVSHDRFFIDKVATRLLVFTGAGRIQEVSGNWTAWRATKG